jgi:hypothetical protein
MPEALIFNGGESPLASKAGETAQGQTTGPTQSDGGPAPDPNQPAVPASAIPGAAEPPLGGVVRAR